MAEFLIDQALKEAIDLHNRNQLDEAKSIYLKIINHDKDQFSVALNSLLYCSLIFGFFNTAHRNKKKAKICL